ncbi:hypothetical protein HI914_03222 [Erysiphe necator]|nr:hypothetical protein HI914_03222 [Erysiphe necator]
MPPVLPLGEGSTAYVLCMPAHGYERTSRTGISPIELLIALKTLENEVFDSDLQYTRLNVVIEPMSTVYRSPLEITVKADI